MIKLGICTGVENAAALAQMGYDYIELALNAAAAMGEEDFATLRHTLLSSGLPCEVMNCMLPGTLPVVGGEANLGAAEHYLNGAFRRAKSLGVKVIVFGSGASRGVPEGFPRDRAWRQLRDYLALANRLAGEYGLRIAIEPLRAGECNILNRVSEAVELAALLELPNVFALGDTYHMSMEHEPLSALGDAGGLLAHVHMARPEGRGYPALGDEADWRGEYAELFRVLKASGYDERVSIEGGCQDFEREAYASFQLLNKLRT